MNTTQPGRGGRPRSERAREAVLHAVDDMLVEDGYAAMTMKGIAERAGVGRQTVYRWWSTKAEILFEASVIDARQELAVEPTGDPIRDLTTYVQGLIRFLTSSTAGAAYRALVGEAQHDDAVATLIAGHDVLMDSARTTLASIAADPATGQGATPDEAAALLVGPVFFWILSGREAARLSPATIATTCLAALQPSPAARH